MNRIEWTKTTALVLTITTLNVPAIVLHYYGLMSRARAESWLESVGLMFGIPGLSEFLSRKDA